MRVLRFLFGNRYARAYLLVVAAVAVLVALVLWIARTPILPASDLLEGRDMLESRFWQAAARAAGQSQLRPARPCRRGGWFRH